MEIFNTVTLLCFLIFGSCEDHEHYNYNYEYDIVTRRKNNPEKVFRDWCSLPCGKTKNIVCIYGGTCNPKSPCVEVILDKGEILGIHNNLRNKFAIGNERAAGGIKVANMMALKWNADLALTASCNLVECKDTRHDFCHKTPKFETVGQNLWSFSGKINVDCATKVLEGIKSWYSELTQTVPEEIQSYAQVYKGNVRTSQFTQLIWATTTHVGCAMVKRADKNGTTCMMTCNYGPGIMKNYRAFHQGLPCSDCSDHSCQINALCWFPYPVHQIGKGPAKVLLPDVCLFIFYYFLLFINILLNKK